MNRYNIHRLRHSPQKAGESGDGRVPTDAHVSQGQAEHQEITGRSQLSDLEKRNDRDRV